MGFQPSDPDLWFLLSVLTASGRGPASLRDILSVGDYINRAILKYEEASEGAERLVRAGILRQVGRRFAATAGFARLWAEAPAPGRGVATRFEAVGRLAGAWPPRTRPGRMRHPITRGEYDAALTAYLGDFWRTGRER